MCRKGHLASQAAGRAALWVLHGIFLLLFWEETVKDAKLMGPCQDEELMEVTGEPS